jgi:short subunit dehydrogenase-like uncharacterized protein
MAQPTMVTKLGQNGAMKRWKNSQASRAAWDAVIWHKKLFVMVFHGAMCPAYFTTGIPILKLYRISKKVYYLLKLQLLFNWLLRTKFVRNYLKKKINRQPAGPSDEQRNKATSLVWGRATNAAGKMATARLNGPEGYTLTTLATLIIVQKVLSGNFSVGYQTPASAYGDLVIEIPGVKREIIS